MKLTKSQLPPAPAHFGPAREIRRCCLLGSIWLCSCAIADKPFKPLPQELICNADDDCEIVAGPLHGCSYGVPMEPYAVARAALEADKALVCTLERHYGQACYTKPEDWVAVCDDNVCKRRKAHFFSWTKVHCTK